MLRTASFRPIGGEATIAIRDNFWAHCDQSAGAESCWPWQRAINGHGYGSIHLGRRINIGAHRWAYILTCGEIPAGLVVMHSCDNRRCVNPAHLKVGTVADNNADRDAKGRGRWAGNDRKIPRGEANCNAKLKAADVFLIRAAIASGKQRKIIAQEVSCTVGAIGLIARGERWGWLT